MSTVPTGQAAPGYYPDPTTGASSWWDGHAWGGYAPPQGTIGQPMAMNRAVQLSTSGYAIAALVLGILWMYGIGSVLAIIFGVLGRKECDRGEKRGRGMATAGLVLGIIGVVGLVLVIILAVAASGTASDYGSYTY